MIRYFWLRIDGKWRFAEKRPNGVMLVWYEDDDDMAEYILTFRGEWVWKMGNKRRRIGLTRWIWLVEVETKELKDRVHRLESRIERAENH